MRVRTLIETKNLDILASVCRFPWPRHGGLSTLGSGSSGGDDGRRGTGVGEDDGGLMQRWQMSRPVATPSRWRFPSLSAPPSDRSRFWTVGTVAVAANLVLCAAGPHLLLWGCATGAHQPSMGWAPPIRARVRVHLVRWAQMVEINTNILPLDLILSFYLFQSLLSTFFFFILCLPTPSRISAYEHASSSRSITDRLNSYNTPLGSEIGTFTLGPLLSGKHRLYRKTHVDCVFSVHTGRQAFSKRIRNNFLSFKLTMHFIMIPDFLLYNV